MTEKGVNSKWALEAINKDVPVSRKSLCIVGSALPSIYITQADPLGINSIKNDLPFRYMVEDLFLSLVAQFNDYDALSKEIVYLYKWLWEQASLPVRDIFYTLFT